MNLPAIFTWFCRRWRTVKWWWQRRTRGWDDSEIWNLDVSLAKLILPRLKQFAKDTHGFPAIYEDNGGYDAWQRDLGKMIAAFELIVSDGYWLMEPEDQTKVNEGLELFAKYYCGLWT